jgi:hypothetical protein
MTNTLWKGQGGQTSPLEEEEENKSVPVSVEGSEGRREQRVSFV